MEISDSDSSTAARLSQKIGVAPEDGKSYDLFDFELWYDDGALATRRWREAPPLADIQDERENALEVMLTRSR